MTDAPLEIRVEAEFSCYDSHTGKPKWSCRLHDLNRTDEGYFDTKYLRADLTLSDLKRLRPDLVDEVIEECAKVAKGYRDAADARSDLTGRLGNDAARQRHEAEAGAASRIYAAICARKGE